MPEHRVLLITYPLSESNLSRIREVASEGFRVMYTPSPEVCTEEILSGAEVIFGEPSQEEIKLATHLRWLHVASAGVDHVLFPELKERHVVLTNSRGMHGPQIAELVFGFLLQWSRRLPIWAEQQKQHRWDKRPYKQMKVLHGLTMVIVGYGNVGLAIARAALGFGMHVIGVRRTSSGKARDELGVELLDLDSALPRADVVVNALPQTPETVKLFSREKFNLMVRKPFFINVGRGGTVDEAALIEALREGVISGAALDVFSIEPLPAEHPLWNMENVFITPHIAGLIPGYMGIAVGLFLDNLQRYVQAKDLINVVNLDVGY
ncbi:MAG: D-2-hydroxyacid dehydrogenase [Bacteroidota bacterium]